MTSISFFFQVHQPKKLRDFRIFEIGKSDEYFDSKENEYQMRKAANDCYIPMARLLKKLIKQNNGDFKFALSFSGMFLEQAEEYTPEVIHYYQELVATGCVEIIGESYYDTIAFYKDKEEWKKQIKLHKNKIQKLFNLTPKTFKNTHFAYSDDLAKEIASLGFNTVLLEEIENTSPRKVYSNPSERLQILFNDQSLSDDLTKRFSNNQWDQFPLTTEKYVSWLAANTKDNQCINLFFDIHTFGMKNLNESGIFEFLRYLPSKIIETKGLDIYLPSTISAIPLSCPSFSCPEVITSADKNRNLSAYENTEMQKECLEKVFEVKENLSSGANKNLVKKWQELTCANNFLAMSNKNYSSEDMPEICKLYDSPYDAYINYINILRDFETRFNKQLTIQDLLSTV